MNDFSVRAGSQVPLIVEQGDVESISATLILREQTTDELIEVTGVYAEDEDGNMVADVSLSATDTAITGVYDYQVNENFTSDDPLKYPDPENCADGECGFPTITICEALDVEETS